MPVKSLPSSPSLDHLKYQARDLLNALKQGNPEAVARMREFHPKFARLSDAEIRALKLSLADAQLVIAREYGFPGWPKLKHHVEVSARAAAASVGPSGFKPPAGPVELRQKWPLGASFVRETNLKQNMEIHTPGKADPMKPELTLTSQQAYTVVAELPDGGREVELQHLGFRLESDSGGYLWRYDSARKSAADQSEVAKVFQTILRSKVRYFLDARCQLERMDGVDELVNRLNMYEGARLKPGMTWDNQALDKVLSRILSGTQHSMENAARGLKRMFNEDYFRNKLDPAFFPGKAVQPGDSWTCTRETPKSKRGFLNPGLRREFTVIFRSWEMHADRLCVRLEFRGTEKTCPQTGPETARTIHPVTEGAFSGVVWFDPESGRGIEMNVNHDFTVTSNKVAIPVLPGVIPKPLMQPVTDHHHQVITEKLVSVTNGGGSA